MPGLEAALAEVPEGERYGIEPDLTAEGGDLNAGADDPNNDPSADNPQGA
jgi:hypothetical protein